MILFHVIYAVTLFFETFLCTCQEVENSKYGTRNTSKTGSTTGLNKDMPLILNTNHAVGVTDEVKEITLFYKQRQKHTHFVKPVYLYHEKGRPYNHRTGSIRIIAYFLILLTLLTYTYFLFSD